MIKTERDIFVKCEYLENPLGIQNRFPRFSWMVSSKWSNTIQTGYQITVRDQNGRQVWNSGKRKSQDCSAVEYEGEALRSKGIYEWDVTVNLEFCDGKHGNKTLTGGGTFEMGLLSQEDWDGCWMCAPDVPAGASPLIRKSFIVEKIPQKARVYISGLGYCETFLNGKRLGDAYLDPAWTDYPKTVMYRTFDILPYLQEGENVLAIELGNGWLGNDSPIFPSMVGKKLPWLEKPRLLCNICLDERTFASCEDKTWYYTDGPVIFNNIYDGEIYDAAKEKKGYREPGYRINAQEWKSCRVCTREIGKLRSQIMQPIEITGRYEPEKVYYIGEKQDYTMVADFGKNCSGCMEIKAKGKYGQKIQMRFAETVNADGSIDQRNLRSAKACDTYIFGEDEEITWHPHFVYHGFRYTEITMDEGVLINQMEALEMHNKVEATGRFSSSNRVLNAIEKAVCSTEINNLHNVPTDCPQRDERLGWLNDMTVRFEEGLYHYDLILLYEKWLQDICDGQTPEGAIPDTAPYFFGNCPASHISSVFILLPWYLYLFYGDKQIMRSLFENMERYFAFKMNARDSERILPKEFFGDWAPPMKYAVLGYGENAVPGNVTQELLTTGYLYYDAVILAQISDVLGWQEKARYYRKTAGEIGEDINKKFLDREAGGYGKLSQGDNVFPLFLNLVPKQNHDEVLDCVIGDLKKRNCHISTGNQMTKYLFEVLDMENVPELAFALASSETYPSLGYMLKEGATTIWERWENLSVSHMNSHNHPMLGAYTAWFYKGLSGLRYFDPKTREITISPSLITELDEVDAEHIYPWGTCRVHYCKDGKKMIMKVSVPWNTWVKIDLSHCCVPCEKIICDGEELSRVKFEQKVFQPGTYQLELEEA